MCYLRQAFDPCDDVVVVATIVATVVAVGDGDVVDVADAVAAAAVGCCCRS